MGIKYVGIWQDGKKADKGTYIFTSGDRYVGSWKDNKANGEGIYTFVNGDTYVGEIKDSTLQGQGTLTYAIGDQYIGNFLDNKRHGQGTQTYADGSTYVGEWKNDKRDGQGSYELKTALMNMVQDGTWKDDVFQEEEPPAAVVNELGQTVCPGSPYDTAKQSNITQNWTDCVGKEYWEYAGGGSYSGGYKNGRWHGLGTFIKQPGEKYIGEWKDGFKNGEGIQTYPDGTVEEGIWKDDMFQEAKKTTLPALVIPDPTQENKRPKLGIKNLCSELNPELCSASVVCAEATVQSNNLGSSDKKEWRIPYISYKWTAFLQEANRRGLNCGIKLKSNPMDANSKTTKLNTKVCGTVVLKNCSNNELCSKAASNGSWVKPIYLKPFITEAKKRGLACGVLDAKDTKGLLAKSIQTELNRIGCNAGTPDGVVGPASRRALKRFNEANNTLYNPDVFLAEKRYLKT